MNTIFALFNMGGMELVLIFAVILLLFGAKKLPELAKGLGQGIKEFKKASNEVTEEFHRAADMDSPAPTKKLPPEGSQPADTASHTEPNHPQ
jgi:sec-independent protein translocase protein TatA